MKIIPKKAESSLPSVRGDDPFSRMITAFSPWTGFFDDFLRRDPLSGSALPTTDVSEETDAYVVRIDVPGVDKDALEVTIDGNMLSVKAHRVTKTETGESTLDYRRAFSLPEHVKADDISGTLKDGILTLRVPKSEDSKPRKISIAA